MVCRLHQRGGNGKMVMPGVLGGATRSLRMSCYGAHRDIQKDTILRK